MKKRFLLLWLMCPVVLVYLHFEFGPKFQFDAQLNDSLKTVHAHEKAGDWTAAAEDYNAILEQIADYRNVQRESSKGASSDKEKGNLDENQTFTKIDRIEIRIKLAQAKALTNISKISLATTLLEDLLFELEEKNIHDELTDEIRNNLAICQYYIAWHLRLEGALREDWFPELEASRQLFKYLATQSKNNGQEKKSSDFMKNLEAVIRLERMDLPALRRLKLPDQGAGKGESGIGIKHKNNKNKSKKSPQQKKGGKGKGKGNKAAKDSRKGGFKKYKLPAGS